MGHLVGEALPRVPYPSTQRAKGASGQHASTAWAVGELGRWVARSRARLVPILAAGPLRRNCSHAASSKTDIFTRLLSVKSSIIHPTPLSFFLPVPLLVQLHISEGEQRQRGDRGLLLQTGKAGR